MHHSSLRSVVGGLQLRVVDDMSAHGGGSDETAVGKVLKLIPVDIGSLALLPSPDGRTGACAVESAVNVGSHDLAVVVDGTLDDGALSPGNAGVGDEHVETAIEFLEDLLDCGLDFLGVLYVHLVRSACMPRIR